MSREHGAEIEVCEVSEHFQDFSVKLAQSNESTEIETIVKNPTKRTFRVPAVSKKLFQRAATSRGKSGVNFTSPSFLSSVALKSGPPLV